MKIPYEYPVGAEIDDGALIRQGLAVPIPAEAGPVGFMSVFSRSTAHAFDDGDRRALEELAERAGPAIDNALRFREARQLADLDALTGLHNRRFFHDTLSREVARAHGGDAWVSSSPAGGARFVLELPAATSVERDA